MFLIVIKLLTPLLCHKLNLVREFNKAKETINSGLFCSKHK